jgi:hypothetical protein
LRETAAFVNKEFEGPDGRRVCTEKVDFQVLAMDFSGVSALAGMTG